VGLWDRIRQALSTVWADWQGSITDERTRLLIGFAEAWRTEQQATTQIRQLIPMIPYEQFRRQLEGIARDDEAHALLVQERLTTLGGMLGEGLKNRAGSENSLPPGPWHRLQQVLTLKRGLYEHYREAANIIDNPGVQPLLQRLRDEEARHQAEILSILMRLDAHLHEPPE
jgi:rubrerythrin